jgi:hypothetical protein
MDRSDHRPSLGPGPTDYGNTESALVGSVLRLMIWRPADLR